jgi:hypothetical protein
MMAASPKQLGQPMSDPEELGTAVSAANDLLVSSLAVGDNPTTYDVELDAQIAAYRASIAQLAGHLGPEATADAAQLSSNPHGRDQANSNAGTGQQQDAADMPVPGLGREGVDYTVRCCAQYVAFAPEAAWQPKSQCFDKL